jgi:hypothetical protein
VLHHHYQNVIPVRHRDDQKDPHYLIYLISLVSSPESDIPDLSSVTTREKTGANTSDLTGISTIAHSCPTNVIDKPPPLPSHW